MLLLLLLHSILIFSFELSLKLAGGNFQLEGWDGGEIGGIDKEQKQQLVASISHSTTPQKVTTSG